MAQEATSPSDRERRPRASPSPAGPSTGRRPSRGWVGGAAARRGSCRPSSSLRRAEATIGYRAKIASDDAAPRPDDRAAADPDLRTQREERVHRAERGRGCSPCVSAVSPSAAPAATSQAGRWVTRTARRPGRRQRREEDHRPVEQHLPRDDDVVRHQRDDQRREQPGPAAVQDRAEADDDEDGGDARARPTPAGRRSPRSPGGSRRDSSIWNSSGCARNVGK